MRSLVILCLAFLGFAIASAEPKANTVGTAACPFSERLVEGRNAFALDIYRRLGKGDEGRNVVISPPSLYNVLGMVYAGARGRTDEEMAVAMHMRLSRRELLRALGEAARRGADESERTMWTANALWVHKDVELLPSFDRVLREEFQSPARVIDFRSDPDEARNAINPWVSCETAGEIPDLIDKLDRRTRLAAVNAVFFHAAWKIPFDVKNTKRAPFHVDNERSVPMDVMSLAHAFPYGKFLGCAVVALPYASGDLSMLLVLPDRPDGLPNVEKTLSPEKAAAWRRQLKPRNVYLQLPRFEARSSFELKPTLVEMGMSSAFGDRADFSGIEKSGSIDRIDRVLHQSVIRIDEHGTTAAAGSGVVVARDKVAFNVDRPFLFLVCDMKTGEILFLGRFVTPE